MIARMIGDLGRSEDHVGDRRGEVVPIALPTVTARDDCRPGPRLKLGSDHLRAVPRPCR